MSMLSAQCDELRQMAESVGLAMPQAATLMMEAADTILSLRDRAQELQAENAKLCEENQSIGLAAYELGRKSMAGENAKLRELVRDIYGEYRYLRVRFHRTYVQHEERMRAVEQRMRELGIEVD